MIQYENTAEMKNVFSIQNSGMQNSIIDMWCYKDASKVINTFGSCAKLPD